MSKAQLLGRLATAWTMLVAIQTGLLHMQVGSAPYGPFESENEAKAHPLHAVRARAVQDLRVLLLQASDAVIPDRDRGIVRIFADGGAALLDAATEVVGVVEAEEAAVAAMLETSDGSTVDLQFNLAVALEAGPRIFAAQREMGITLVLCRT